MKLYCLTNMYCNGIQAGIQAFHAGIRLVKEYENDTCSGSYYSTMINEWYNDHETIVVLNAGDHSSLLAYHDLLSQQASIPYAKFNEPGLNHALTSIAVLCTEEMVEDMKTMRSGDLMLKLELAKQYSPNTYAVLEAISSMRTVS